MMVTAATATAQGQGRVTVNMARGVPSFPRLAFCCGCSKHLEADDAAYDARRDTFVATCPRCGARTNFSALH